MGLVGGQIVLQVEAYDTDNDGDIDQIVVTTDQNSTTAAGDEIYVNGKTFVTAGATAATQTFTTDGGVVTGSVGSDEIAGTASDHLTITTVNGSIVVNAGRVVDRAGVVVLKADATLGSNTVVLTLSERAYGSLALGDIDATSEFAFVPNGGAAVAITGPTSTNGGVTTVTVTLGANADATNMTSSTMAAAAALEDAPTFDGETDMTGTAINNPGNGTTPVLFQ